MSGKKWSIEEIELLIKYYPNTPNNIITSIISRPQNSIKAKANELKISKNEYWSIEDVELLMKYYPIYKNNDICSMLNRSLDSIQHKAMKLNLTKNRFWSTKDIILLKQDFINFSVSDLSKNFNRSKNEISQKMSELNLKQGFKFRRLGSAENLLNETLESFYWIGFLLADGHFTKNKSSIQLSLSRKDRLHLEKYTYFLNLKEQRIKDTSRKTNKCDYYENSITTIHNKDIIPKIMKKFDIHPRKTYNPPDFSKYNFTDEQMLSLIIGFIDGDGSINKTGTCIKIKCHISWLQNLQFMRSFIHKFYNELENFPVQSKNNYSLMLIGKKKLLHNIKKFIINNNLPILDRKWNRIIIN